MPSAVRHAARRGAGAAARLALEERHTIAAVITGAVAGYMRRSGTTIPHVSALGIPGTWGAAAWLAARYTKSRTLGHVATGLLTIAAYEMTSSGSLFGTPTTTTTTTPSATLGAGAL